MTFRRTLPFIPAGLIDHVSSTNLKLYSDEQIDEFKRQFKADGKYQYFINAADQKQKLPCSIYVCGGHYFAAFPGGSIRVTEGDSSKIKIIQNLDTGAWGEAKIVDGVTQDDIHNELAVIKKAGQAMQAGDQSEYFYREAESGMAVRRGSRTILPSLFEADDPEWNDGQQGDSVKNGKHYLLSRYARGIDLARWVHHKPGLPMIIKIELAEQLILAVMSIHESHLLHRNIKLQNVIADAFSRLSHAITLVNIGSSHANREASAASDIAALGLTLHYLFRPTLSARADEMSKDTLYRLNILFDEMQHKEPSSRKSLSEVLAEIRNIKLLLSETERTIKVGVLNVIDFIMSEGSGSAAMASLLERLRRYDQVCLHGEDDAVTDFAFLKVKHRLEEAGIVVANEVSNGPVSEMRAYLRANHEMRAQSGRICQSSYITSGIEVNELDTRIQMDDGENDAQESSYSETEEYEVGECVAAFFSDVFQDGLRLFSSAIYGCMPGSSGLYSSSDQRARINSIENSVGLEAELTGQGLHRLF